MIIAGLQKTSLLDYPGKICATVFLAVCNFKCGFCHNPELVVPELIKSESVPMTPQVLMKELDTRMKYIDGVCITGGEPLLNKDIFKLCDEIKKRGLLVKIDTNGTRPNILKQLMDFELVDFVAMDIKGPKEKYSEIAGTDVKIEHIEESVKLLMEGKVDYEFRTTVVKGLHDHSDFIKIGNWIKGAKSYYLQQFNFDGKTVDKKYEDVTPFTPDELQEMLDSVKGKVDKSGIRGI
ncbi:anaerobic ribonucleoside-triphosphate reductase activating protein [Nanoarchaeota archaeon]